METRVAMRERKTFPGLKFGPSRLRSALSGVKVRETDQDGLIIL